MSHNLSFTKVALVTLALALSHSVIGGQNEWPPENWAYWLQNIDLDTLAQIAPDLAIIDYSSDGEEEGEWTSEEIEGLQAAGMTVLAYFSIGEAENYRWYWHEDWEPDDPEWLGPENPDWAGNYKVRYWMEEWQQIIFGVRNDPNKSTLDRILDQGFDGVYLDIVDAYWYWSDENPENDDAAHDMVILLSRIAQYARETREHHDFIIMPQNAPYLPEEVSEEDADTYYSIVNGISAEDTFFYGDEDENNAYNPQESIEMLDAMVNEGKIVLSVEYLTEPVLIDTFYTMARERGYIPLATVRALDRPIMYLSSPPIREDESILPRTAQLVAYPNPFNSTTIITYSLPVAALVSLQLYDLSGREVRSLVEGGRQAGVHRTMLNAADLPSGLYFVRLEAAEYVATQKMMLMR